MVIVQFITDKTKIFRVFYRRIPTGLAVLDFYWEQLFLTFDYNNGTAVFIGLSVFMVALIDRRFKTVKKKANVYTSKVVSVVYLSDAN